MPFLFEKRKIFFDSRACYTKTVFARIIFNVVPSGRPSSLSTHIGYGPRAV